MTTAGEQIDSHETDDASRKTLSIRIDATLHAAIAELAYHWRKTITQTVGDVMTDAVLANPHARAILHAETLADND